MGGRSAHVVSAVLPICEQKFDQSSVSLRSFSSWSLSNGIYRWPDGYFRILKIMVLGRRLFVRASPRSLRSDVPTPRGLSPLHWHMSEPVSVKELANSFFDGAVSIWTNHHFGHALLEQRLRDFNAWPFVSVVDR